MTQKKYQNREVNYIFKAGGGTYGKGAKQTTEDDFVELSANAKITSIPHTPSISIYYQKKKSKFNYDQTLNILFIICTLCLIILKFSVDHLFNTVHEKNLEDLISKLCFAFIASYIFYNVVTKTTDRLKKKEAYAVICALIDSVINNGDQVKKWLLTGAGKDKGFKFDGISKEDLKMFCAEVNIDLIPEEYQESVGNLVVSFGVKRTKFFIDKIFTYMPFLESELLHQLNRLQNSKFTIFIIVIPYKQHRNLKEFSAEILEYFDLIQDLAIYNDKLKKKYLNHNYEKREL